MDAAAAVRVGEKGACAEVIDGVDLRAEVEAESSCRRAATKLAQQSGCVGGVFLRDFLFLLLVACQRAPVREPASECRSPQAT